MKSVINKPGYAGDFHKDPADRIMIAKVRKLAVLLVTANEKIRGYEYVKTIL